MKLTVPSALGLLILAAPLAGQAQFYYSENPGNSSQPGNAVTITITGYHGPDGDVSIPTTIDGLTVTSIGENAFLEEIGVTNITIPASVTSIGESAFSDSGLTAITIPGNVTNIGPEAFANCASLTNSILADGVTSIGASAFNNCPVLGNITIPSSVISIGPFAFSACTGLTNATISNGVISIGDAAFDHCFFLTNIAMPASVTSIGMDAFISCGRLTAITVDTQNPIYASVDGVLYNKSVTSLLEAPPALGGSFTVPASVTSIGNGAFSDCNNLTSLAIPSSVTSIGQYAFYNCSFLTNITIAGGVTSIGEDAFFASFLTSLTIPGSVTNIGDYGFSSIPFLKSAYFEGNAPVADSTAFQGDNDSGTVTIYYLPGTTGWSNTFAGQPTALWLLPRPVILNNGPNFGVQSNTFGFTISWATNSSFVVEACPSLANPVWTPIQTNTLTNGSFYFSEPFQTNISGRFYRISSP